MALAKKGKISIQEAMAVLKSHGLNVEVTPQSNQKADVQQRNVEVKVERKRGNTSVVVELKHQHSIGCGGSLVMEAGERTVINNATVSYGPGLTTIPVKHAQWVLHQEALAEEADRRLRTSEQRSFVVTRKVNTAGSSVFVPTQVPNDLFDDLRMQPDLGIKLS